MTKLAKGPNAPIQDFFKTEIVGKIKIDLTKTVIWKSETKNQQSIQNSLQNWYIQDRPEEKNYLE